MRQEWGNKLQMLRMKVIISLFRNKTNKSQGKMISSICWPVWEIFSKRWRSTKIWRNLQSWDKTNFNSSHLLSTIKSINSNKVFKKVRFQVHTKGLSFRRSMRNRLFSNSRLRLWSWNRRQIEKKRKYHFWDNLSLFLGFRKMILFVMNSKGLSGCYSLLKNMIWVRVAMETKPRCWVQCENDLNLIGCNDMSN